MIDYVLWFFFIWVVSFVLHEFMHCFEHMRQGGKSYRIEFWRWHGLPSMRVYLSGVQRNPRMVELAGGLYTSVVHLLVLLIWLLLVDFGKSGFTYSLICVGLVQYFYGLYEMTYISRIHPDDYMVGHYLLYIFVICIFSVVWFLL